MDPKHYPAPHETPIIAYFINFLGSTMRIWMVISLLVLAGCGQKGALFLPTEEPIRTEPASQAATTDTESPDL